MINCLIVDDRPLRQKTLLGEDNIRMAESFAKFIKYIPTDLAEWNEYSVIAIHRSLLIEKQKYEEVMSFVQSRGKFIVLFSGGTAQTSLVSNNVLEIKATDFYNPDNLIQFLDKISHQDTEPQLLELVYGTNWCISDLIKYQHLRWQYPDSMPEHIEETLYELQERISKCFQINEEEVNSAFVESKIQSVVKIQ